MTGHAAFSRTLRALDADSFRASKLTLLFTAILLAAWTWWFFTPSIPQPLTHATTGAQTTLVSPAHIVLHTLHE